MLGYTVYTEFNLKFIIERNMRGKRVNLEVNIKSYFHDFGDR